MLSIKKYKNNLDIISPFHQVPGLQLIETEEGYTAVCIQYKKELVFAQIKASPRSDNRITAQARGVYKMKGVSHE